MDRAADAMTDPVTDHAKARRLRDLLDRIADITEMDTRTAGRDTGLETLLRRLDKTNHLQIGHAQHDRAGGVAIEAVLENADVGLD